MEVWDFIQRVKSLNASHPLDVAFQFGYLAVQIFFQSDSSCLRSRGAINKVNVNRIHAISPGRIPP